MLRMGLTMTLHPWMLRLGEGARELVDRGTGKVIGEMSADGTKVARFNSADTKGYINLESKTTGSNLHVRWQ
jgi:hypothetical protein